MEEHETESMDRRVAVGTGPECLNPYSLFVLSTKGRGVSTFPGTSVQDQNGEWVRHRGWSPMGVVNDRLNGVGRVEMAGKAGLLLVGTGRRGERPWEPSIESPP